MSTKNDTNKSLSGLEESSSFWSGDLIPTLNNVYNIGLSSLRWARGYFTQLFTTTLTVSTIQPTVSNIALTGNLTVQNLTITGDLSVTNDLTVGGLLSANAIDAGATSLTSLDVIGDTTSNNVTANNTVTAANITANTAVSTNRIQTVSGGNITLANNLIPLTNNTVSLGSNSLRFAKTQSTNYYGPANYRTSFLNIGTGVSVTSTETLIQSFPASSNYDAGGFKIKFPTRGRYVIIIRLYFDKGVPLAFQYFDVKLKENGGSQGDFYRVTSVIDSTTLPTTTAYTNRPCDIVFSWVNTSGNDIVGIYGNSGNSDWTITNVYISSGIIHMVEQFE